MCCAVGASTRVVPQCPVNSCRSLNRSGQNLLWQARFLKSQQAESLLSFLGERVSPTSSHRAKMSYTDQVSGLAALICDYLTRNEQAATKGY
jgi:hypothetical protein